MSKSASKGDEFKIEKCPEIMIKLAKILKEHGHECVSIRGFSNQTFEWCQKDICLEILARNDMDRIEKEQYDFRNDLIAKGHKCIRILESYPSQTSWCKREICQRLNDSDLE